MSTELARALDEELAALGLRAADLGSADYAFALLTLQSLAAHLKGGDVPTEAIARRLVTDPGLADVGEERLHRTNYREIRSRLQQAFGPDAAAPIRVQVDQLVTTGAFAHSARLSQDDHDAVEDFVASRIARRGARAAWEERVGALLSHQQALGLTGWSKQALSQAVREHRVLRLTGSGGERYYPESAFDGASPARPLPGAKQIFGIWAAADPRGWTTASWLVSSQVELEGKSPREVMVHSDGQTDLLRTLARQASSRLEG